MTRRSGQIPSVRIGKRADGSKYYFAQYYIDVPGQEARQRKTEVIGVVGQMTKSEAERKWKVFVLKLGVNLDDYRIPSSKTFADAVKFYRDDWGPRMLRDSTFDVAKGHIRNHLEGDWNHVPIEHIDQGRVSEWSWKKKRAGLSWTMVKNILRTMQRVLTSYQKTTGRPPFSLRDLEIPEKDKFDMGIRSGNKVRFDWNDACRMAAYIRKQSGMDHQRRELCANFIILASASALRPEELTVLRVKDVNFAGSTIAVDESKDRMRKVGRVKNSNALRKVFLGDPEGREALRQLKEFLRARFQGPDEFIFQSKNGKPLELTHVYPLLHRVQKALGLRQGGMRAFRRGCIKRWRDAGIKPDVRLQQAGHSSEEMTELYAGKVDMAEVRAAYSRWNGSENAVSENTENKILA